ncbi:MAG: transposase [Acidimicrobiia bacterium]
MTSIASRRTDVIVGVDTHKHVHVAVAMDRLGVRLGQLSIPVDSGGYRQLAEWSESWGQIDAFRIEGTGSYGAGLTSYLRRQGHRIVEVNRGDRQARRTNGKSDTVDAEAAARAVLNGTATAIPKTADGFAEMIRQIKVARDTAVKARTAAIITLKQWSTPHQPPRTARRASRQGSHRPVRLLPARDDPRPHRLGQTCSPSNSPPLARPHRPRPRSHDTILDDLTHQAASTLRQGFGIGPDTAAEMLIIFGDNPDRVHSEAAFAKLCGTCPVPASSGMTNRHRLYWGGHRQANSAIYRTVIVRMRHHQPTIDYVKRRTAEGLTKRDIIRCLKRLLAREIYQRVMTDHHDRQQAAA